MARATLLASVFSLMLAASSFARQNANSGRQEHKSSAHAVQQQYDDNGNPPEEDKAVAPEKFVLDPLESQRNVKIGDFYWRKGDYIG
ncbi:MAG: hypothetical protein ACRD4O_14420, partial [Bryobacteraceae bacterium]